jgi:hypothetical protein
VTAPTPPTTGRCRECGRPYELTPRGHIPQHPRDQQPMYAKNCDGGRKTPEPETQTTAPTER